jgi:hypothetical protein
VSCEELADKSGYVLTTKSYDATQNAWVTSSVTIKHGTDGIDGENGADAPAVGVKQDTDGNWYWTIGTGENNWLLDAAGNKVRANGIDGEDGKDGKTPVFAIKDGNLYYTYDGEDASADKWILLGDVTGEDGEDGADALTKVEGETDANGQYTGKVTITLSNGTVLAPGSTERGVWKPFVDRLSAHGAWEKVEIPSDESVNLIQPTLWESQSGCVHALMRSNDGHIYRSDSTDFGATWCKAYQTPHPNNNSGIDCAYTKDGVLFLVCNPVTTNWGQRTPLSIFASRDNGITFTEELQLENVPGEFSYPAVITHGDRLYVSYTYQRSFIAFCEIEM